MTFQPKGGDHAITEVVFGILLARSFAPADIEALIAAHDRWRDELPKLNRGNIIEIALGDQEPDDKPREDAIRPQIPQLTVSFDRIKPDGNIAWRLRANPSGLFVNCLVYDRWSEVWPKVASFLKAAYEVAAGSDNAIRTIALQYIDVFEWLAPLEDYRIDALLNRDSPHVPKALWDKSYLWHLHEGWYRSDDLPVPGRLLERIHLDAVVDNNGRPTVRMDTALNLEIATEEHISDPFGEFSAVTDRLFNNLHGLNKGLVRAYITEDMAERIGLND